MKLQSVLLLALSVFGGCEIAGPTTDHPSAGESGARIVFGASMDGIEIGDDTTAVINRLGRPDAVGLGDFPGVTFVYTYPAPDARGLLDSLEVTIVTEAGSGWGEGVQTMKASGPYSGTTSHGVGIGTSHGRVVQVFGAPDESVSSSNARELRDTYCFERTSFVLTYVESRLTAIKMSTRCTE